jgi:hypothetical protein
MTTGRINQVTATMICNLIASTKKYNDFVSVVTLARLSH